MSAYIHIPFCSYKCDFCDFAAYAGLLHLADEYCEIVCAEIDARLKDLKEIHSKPVLQSVFYGGGTPGLVEPKLLMRIHEKLLQYVHLAPDAEISLETTPQTVTADKAKAWQDLGINRLSIGVESLQDSELKAIGRNHTSKEAIQGVEQAVEAGFTNINCDFMYNLPTQTLASWQGTLRQFIKLAGQFDSIKHISAYALELVSHAPLLVSFPADSLAYPPDHEFDSYYNALRGMTEDAGFEQYEVSNFAKPGFQSRHNLSYWNNDQYLAFGVGAHRYVDGVRSANWKALRRYMADYLGSELEETIDSQTNLKEAIMLGLRQTAGIDLSAFQKRYGTDLLVKFAVPIDKLKAGSLIRTDGGRLTLTPEAVPISNLVLAEFF